MVTRLADILVIAVLRSWLSEAPQAETGWLAGVRDPRLGRALFAIHERPAHPWDLASLGKEAGMSRSAFSGRFTTVVGEPAMQYLTRWRLQLAHRELQQTPDGLGEIAQRVGYSTEAAFCKAFKREFGVTPSSVRGG
jgi:AraC-like DNA-binding protein